MSFRKNKNYQIDPDYKSMHDALDSTLEAFGAGAKALKTFAEEMNNALRENDRKFGIKPHSTHEERVEIYKKWISENWFNTKE